MSIEAGARAGLIAPDETTFAYLSGRPLVPTGTAFDDAKAAWRALRSDAGAVYDKVVEIDAADIAPMVTWGTNPEAVVTIVDRVPDPDRLPDPDAASQARRRLDYMGLTPGTLIEGLSTDVGLGKGAGTEGVGK